MMLETSLKRWLDFLAAAATSTAKSTARDKRDGCTPDIQNCVTPSA